MSESPHKLYTVDYDLTNCDVEPLHLIRSFQKPAALLVLDPQCKHILAASDNTNLFWNGPSASLPGKPIAAVLSGELIFRLNQVIDSGEIEEANPIINGNLTNEHFPHGANIIIHQKNGLYYLEFEPMEPSLSSSAFLFQVDKALQNIQRIQQEDKLYSAVVQEVRKLTGFDRVMLYRFDKDFNGEIVGEDRREDLPAYLNLRYPHTDIPKQARDLYFINRIRQITSTRAEDAATIHYHPDIDQLDLALANNRGVSPIHLQYLNNIGVSASLSVAIIVDQKLWGLIACHHQTPKLVDFRLRSMINFLVKIMSGHLALWQSSDFRKQVLSTSITRSRLFERMNERYDIVDGLLNNDQDLLQLTGATGAVLILDQQQYHTGKTPSNDETAALAEWLSGKSDSALATHELFEEYPAARSFSNAPAGLLSIRLTESPGEYVMWFRPETVTTINWGGRPEDRKVIRDGKVQLHPEMSFEKYSENIAGLADKWKQHQIDAALTLRSDIKEIILQKYKEVTRLNGQLMDAYEELESFSYTVSHDLRAPLRNVKGYAEILQEDYYEQLDDYGKSALKTIISSVGKMNQFINDILSFSRVSRTKIEASEIELKPLIEDIWNELSTGNKRNPKLILQLEVDNIEGGYVQIKQVFQNLISNSLKYASPERLLEVIISSKSVSGTIEIKIQDNGIGFDPKYADRIFAVFSRLVSDEDYPGTGVGLAIAKRLVDKHNGKISVDSSLNKGTVFTLTFPEGFINDHDQVAPPHLLP